MAAAWIAVAASAWSLNAATRRCFSALLVASSAARIEETVEEDEVEKPTASPAFPNGTVTVELAAVTPLDPTAETAKPDIPAGANLTEPLLASAAARGGEGGGGRRGE